MSPADFQSGWRYGADLSAWMVLATRMRLSCASNGGLIVTSGKMVELEVG